jgi:hypothetical protein
VAGGASECGKCVMNTALARYNTDGTLDTTFGNGGMVDVTAVGAVASLAEDAAGESSRQEPLGPLALAGLRNLAPPARSIRPSHLPLSRFPPTEGPSPSSPTATL